MSGYGVPARSQKSPDLEADLHDELERNLEEGKERRRLRSIRKTTLVL